MKPTTSYRVADNPPRRCELIAVGISLIVFWSIVGYIAFVVLA